MIQQLLTRFKNTNLILLLIVDSILIISSFFISILLRYDLLFPTELAFTFNYYFLFYLLLIKIGSFRLFKLYRGMWRYTSIFDMIRIVKSNVIASSITVCMIYFIYSFHSYSRAIFVIDFVLCTVLVGSSRVGIRLFFSNIIFSFNKNIDLNKKDIIIIGAGVTGENILRESLRKNNHQINVIGLLDDDNSKQFSRLHNVPVLGKVNDLVSLSVPFDEIYICVPTASKEQMRSIVEECKKTNKPFKTLPSLSELMEGKVSVSQLRDVSLVDLLGRDEISLDAGSIQKFISGKRIIVTGAGGSIGSELVRQLINFNPSLIILLDFSELNLFQIDQETSNVNTSILFKPVLSDIKDKNFIYKLFDEYKPQVVFHAAAYKHVPIQEFFPQEAIKTNVFGTMNLTEASIKFSVEKFVLVSTDKAVRPTNVMGATKRIAELICQDANEKQNSTEFMAVRFGNVLGSSGSVIPIFQKQIKDGGPLTITDPEMKRYFMSIPEASQLILQAGAIGIGGEVFILDMGEPIKIIDIAKELIRLSGYEPDEEILIKVIGSRPGEKKIEELSLDSNNLNQTKHRKIMVYNDLKNTSKSIKSIIDGVVNLGDDLKSKTPDTIKNDLSKILPEYTPKDYIEAQSFINNTEEKAKA